MFSTCEGTPEGPCPNSCCDETVHYSIYDVFVCPACEKVRADRENVSRSDAAHNSANNIEVGSQVKGKTSKKAANSKTANKSSKSSQSCETAKQSPIYTSAAPARRVTRATRLTAPVALDTHIYMHECSIESDPPSASSPPGETEDARSECGEKRAVNVKKAAKKVSSNRDTKKTKASTQAATNSRTEDSERSHQRLNEPAYLSTAPPEAMRQPPGQGQGNSDTCPQCLLTIAGGRFLVCDVCQLKHHSQCAAISDNVYDQLGKLLNGIGWVCADCKILARSLSARIQASLASLAAEVTSLQSQFSDLSRRVDGHACNHSDRNVAAAATADASQQATSNSGDNGIHTVVYKVCRDLSRRKQNVIITGMPENDTVSDRDAFLQLCTSYLGTKPNIGDNDCMRIGKVIPGKKRRLLVRLRSETAASELLRSASRLRHADQADVTEVYINPDLSPSEAKLAYEERQLRRDRKMQRLAAHTDNMEADVNGTSSQPGNSTAVASAASPTPAADNNIIHTASVTSSFQHDSASKQQ